MSALSEMLIALSMIGYLFLCIYWFWKDRNLTRSVLRLLLLIGVMFGLHAIFDFPKVLLRPEETTISKGSEGTTEAWPIYVCAYLSMLAGMFCQYLYARFSREAAQRPPFDWGSFIAPVFVSPIVFVPLCSTLGVGEHAETGRYMIFLIAFENGFFFKGYFDQRNRTNHGSKSKSLR
jgi:hypothetical protein